MRRAAAMLAAALALLGACSEPSRPQRAVGATAVGAPRLAADEALLASPGASAPPARDGDRIRLPDRIVLPAAYRLILLDGHLALVREADAQAVDPAPTSLRILMGEVARGELAYQPALLPQELAAEVASNRESAARMDNALETVMRRSRELTAKALELEAQSKRLEQLLEEARARPHSAAPDSPPSPEAPPPRRTPGD
jgi:hypothetical protein